MNNLPREVFSSVMLENVWIFENRQYRYYGEKHLPYSLPIVSLEYEAALKENGTPYRIKDDNCEYWSPVLFEEKEVTAPLYARVGNVYRYTKSYTGTVPSQESINAAKQTKEVVDYTIEKMKLYQKIKSVLPEGELTKAFRSSHLCTTKTDVCFNGEHFLILPISTRRFLTEFYIAVDMNLIKPFSDLEIKVPKGKVGLFIGKCGWQVQEISKALMYRRISFVEEA